MKEDRANHYCLLLVMSRIPNSILLIVMSQMIHVCDTQWIIKNVTFYFWL